MSIFHASCECGYQSDRLYSIFESCVCPHCRDLVGVSRLLNRYELMPCPKCNSPMLEDDLFSEIIGEQCWLVTEKTSGLTCPKCNSAKLEFHSDGEIDCIDGLWFPGVGDLVDGCINQDGDLDIPWFPLESAKANHDLPAGLKPGQRITMRVMAIKTKKAPTGSILAMFHENIVSELDLEYIGLLSANHRPETLDLNPGTRPTL